MNTELRTKAEAFILGLIDSSFTEHDIDTELNDLYSDYCSEDQDSGAARDMLMSEMDADQRHAWIETEEQEDQLTIAVIKIWTGEEDTF